MLLSRLATRLFSGSSQETVGFIGLGQMGSRMAPHLVKAGFRVVVFDAVAAATKEMSSLGATVAASPAAVASQANVLVTMLPNSKIVNEVYLGRDGVFAAAKPGMLTIDSSTIDPATAKEVATAAAKLGVAFVDAPVSGGVGGAAAATLTFMCGARSDADFERARSYLRHMGKNIVRCGDVSTGQVAKICNNLILAVSMTAVSEAMNIGVTLGMDPKTLAGIINTSSGRCWSSDTYNPCPGVMDNVPSSRGYTGGFGSPLMHKDLGLAVTAAQSAGCSAELGKHVLDMYSRLIADGYADKDFSVMYKFINSKNTGKK